uniref:Alpha-galactosidase n=1 Tax=Panagrellus redivivus TaxID=6233 RepID=A0A7E4VJU6_PANRE
MRASLIVVAFYHLIQLSVALNNGLAKKPPMGWNSWVRFLCETDCVQNPNTCISSKLYQTMADFLIEEGYTDVGYTSVNVDDCWMSDARNKEGTLPANQTRFPDGILALAEFMHNRNLTFGIYQTVDTLTCQKYPGSFGHFKKDAETFAKWHVDYLKLDSCGLNGTLMPRAYKTMGKALNHTSRPILYSCSWPLGMLDKYSELINYTEIAAYCNTWRNYYDVLPEWDTILRIIDWYTLQQNTLAAVHGPGAWNDPDMIVVGNPGLTDDQARVQMTLWSIWSAPLIMSNDLRLVTASQKAILTNKDVIAIDQDELANFGKHLFFLDGFDVYRKNVTPVNAQETSLAFGILNRYNKSRPFHAPISILGMRSEKGYHVKDLWAGTDLGLFKGEENISFSVPATGITFIKAELDNR